MSNQSPRQRTRAYVQENAAQGVAHALSLPREQWQRLASTLAGVTEEEAAFRPSADDWTIAEVLEHLRLSLGHNRDRIETMSGGTAFTEPPYATGTLPDQREPSFEAARARFFADANALLALAQAAEPGANLELTAAHAAFGPYNWVEWLVHLAVHARAHTEQIENLRAAWRGAGATAGPERKV
jgi:hypothetical protein